MKNKKTYKDVYKICYSSKDGQIVDKVTKYVTTNNIQEAAKLAEALIPKNCGWVSKIEFEKQVVTYYYEFS
jgi:hypothetical protein